MDTREEKPSEWLALERRVAQAYSQFGYDAKHNVNHGGHQIDVLCKKDQPGAPTVTVAIEVKYKSSANVGITDYTKFANAAHDLLARKLITSAVLVTNAEFTREARQASANQDHLLLITVTELEQSVRLGGQRAVSQLAHYRASELARLFVDVRVRPRRDSGPISTEDLIEVSTVKTCSDLRFMASRFAGRALIAVFADYGAGKTTALERIHAQCLEDYLRGNTNLFPIIYPLKYLLDHTSVNDFIAHSVEEALGTTFDRKYFWERANSFGWLHLLDGFDEISVQPTRSERISYLRQLSPLMLGHSPAILASRPSFFAEWHELRESIKKITESYGLSASTNERHRGLSADARALAVALRSSLPGDERIIHGRVAEFELESLTPSEVGSYLQKRQEEFAAVGIRSPGDVQDFIDSVYDFSDLVSRPILLRLITDTIIHGAIDVYSRDQSLGPSDLYEIYAGLRLQYDLDKGAVRTSGLTPAQRRKIAELCAQSMNRLGVSQLSTAQLQELLNAEGPIGHHDEDAALDHDLEPLLADIRTCSFMTVTPSNAVCFIHKSFLEYFLACRFSDAVLADDLLALEQRVPSETAYFLGSMMSPGRRDPGPANRLSAQARICLGRLARGSSPGRDSLAASNLATALLYQGGGAIRGVELQGLTTGIVHRDRLQLTGARLLHVGLHVEVEALELTEAVLSNVSVRGTCNELVLRRSAGIASSVYLSSPRLHVDASSGRLAFHDAHIPDANIRHSHVSMSGAGSRIENLVAESSTVELSGEIDCHTLDAMRCNLEVPVASIPTRGHLSGSVLRLTREAGSRFTGSPVGEVFRVSRSIAVVSPHADVQALRHLELDHAILVGGRVGATAVGSGRPDKSSPVGVVGAGNGRQNADVARVDQLRWANAPVIVVRDDVLENLVRKLTAAAEGESPLRSCASALSRELHGLASDASDQRLRAAMEGLAGAAEEIGDSGHGSLYA